MSPKAEEGSSNAILPTGCHYLISLHLRGDAPLTAFIMDCRKAAALSCKTISIVITRPRSSRRTPERLPNLPPALHM